VCMMSLVWDVESGNRNPEAHLYSSYIDHTKEMLMIN